MRTLTHPVFIGSLLLFLLNQVLELQQVHIKLLAHYLDDLLCMPVVLTIALTAERLYFRNPAFVFAPVYSVVAVVLFSICFELVLPAFSSKYTADALDMVFYSLGALIFQVTVNKPLNRAVQP
ncbi:hypothetical protein H7F15_00750 [Pontibacter sp. Tf4]|uniref:hypothetical protein n=1 Tax=Pontibacter sp. Tf4 TaxID=2761620 RepID=UPI0016297F98|nr:hypothetical protein [Pontibacter sp. Tf4]MBB6609553.1 hypothetical protein [Pontibacter sp. Tf4]